MTNPVPLTEIWRGPIVESLHLGHAVICDTKGDIVEAWGSPEAVVYPRSSAKMIQALPLVESGAADARGLTSEHLALACASHQAGAMHTDRVRAWLSDLGLSDEDLRCGPQMPQDRAAFNHMICNDEKPCQVHNACSGKHAGFLTLAQYQDAGPDYIDIDHPVQKACLEAFESVTGESSPGHGIDGCAAPNFLTTMHGMARAMSWFAGAVDGADARQTAAVRLWQAMIAHPELVAGERRACTDLMRACSEPVALKTGAEGFFVGIAPTRGLGIAIKIADGATRGANCTITALLIRLGLLDPANPAAKRFCNTPILNRRQEETGVMKPVSDLL